MRIVTDCPGCARRREAMRDFGRKMADWILKPVGIPPLDPTPPTPRDVPTAVQAEALDRIRKLTSSNKT